MSSIKNQIINEIIRLEGGYVNDPHDLGGETKYGITKETALKHGYTGSMKDLPYDLAFDIYSKSYWDVNRLDEISSLSEKVALEVADTGVNMGVKVAAKFLQRSINALNYRQEDLKVDGLIGSKTLGHLANVLFQMKGEEALLKALNCLQGARYIELTEAREKNKRFVRGWLIHRVVI